MSFALDLTSRRVRGSSRAEKKNRIHKRELLPHL